MLAFIFTDAPLPSSVLQALLSGLTPQTFNAITVDTDTSTSDTVLLFGSGSASLPNPVTDAGDRRLKAFRGALEAVMLDLAQQIVRDGEGASKFITVNVSGAKSARAAKKIAFSVANSPLVKTAIAGEDANWGRIVMAVGKSGEQADRDALKIWIGDELVTENGFAAPSYDEAKANRHLKGKEVTLCVDVGVGRGRATVWTCDLTHDYIAINADYRS